MQKTTERYLNLLIEENTQKANRVFTFLLLFQWALSVVLALWLTNRTWVGMQSSIHPHLIAATCVGGLLALGPIALFRIFPGHPGNTCVVAASQMFFSTLLITITGGRIETHFHIFVSLAFLSIYRKKRPIIVASVITVADHFFRGTYYPESVYGVAFASPLRAIEHGAWLFFEAAVLLRTIEAAEREMRSICEIRAKLEIALTTSAKMSALGEFMSGVAHEINNPLAAITGAIDIRELKRKKLTTAEPESDQAFAIVRRNAQRIIKIVKSLKSFSRTSVNDPMEFVPLNTIMNDVRDICSDSLKSRSIEFRIHVEEGIELECRPSEIEQVLVNLVGNSRDAISEMSDRWITITGTRIGESVSIAVTDSGNGIPDEVLDQLMTPFFTTKPKGLGTGLGLTISKKVAAAHGGALVYDRNSRNTSFLLQLPMKQAKAPPTTEVEAA